MAYTSGDNILDDHYNTFAADVNAVWGTGTGNSGYGQASTVETVSQGDTVTATQWATLLSRVSSAAAHQNSSLTAITNPTVGDDIAAVAAISNNINTITTNRQNAAASGTTKSLSIIGTGSWTTITTAQSHVVFASGDQARYFFNAGGKIVVDFNRTGGTSHSKNTEWTDQCNDAGQLHITADSVYTANNSGGQTVLATTLGYWNLTETWQTVYWKYADTSPYTASSIKVQLRRATQAGTDNGNQVRVRVQYLDDATDTSTPSSVDIVDGTITTLFTVMYPSTAVLTDSWGAPTLSTTTNTQS